MMSVSELFYGGRDHPLWIVHTPSSAQKSSSGDPQTPQSAIRGSPADGLNFNSPYNSTLEFKVPLCCEACEERVKHALLNFKGVESVKCDTADQRVTVTGSAAPADLLKICRKLHKRSELLTTSKAPKNANPSPKYGTPKYGTPKYASPKYASPKFDS